LSTFVSMNTEYVLTSLRYPLIVAEDSYETLAKTLKSDADSDCSFFILVDENTHQHCLPQLITNVEALSSAEIIEIDSGEENKNIETCKQLWEVLTELGADRRSVLINLGGGVITDMGGFVAATYKRGIRFYNIPTTLLAQVDASTGSKTGVDLGGLKNQIGLFTDPQAVFINPGFLHTLPNDQLQSGFGEIVKHALIADKEYWKMVKENYTEHNPSVTISIGDSEWIAVANWVYENWDICGGLSFLPREDAVYKLAPYEAIDEKKYKELAKHMEHVDYSKIITYEKQDELDLKKELACAGGVCEIM